MAPIDLPKRSSSAPPSLRTGTTHTSATQGNAPKGNVTQTQQTQQTEATQQTTSPSPTRQNQVRDGFRTEGGSTANNNQLQGASARPSTPLRSMSLGKSRGVEPKGTASVDKGAQAQKTLAALHKQGTTPPYDTLTQVMKDSDGKINSAQAYGKPVMGEDGEPKKLTKSDQKKHLKSPENWHPERAKIQEGMVSARLDQAQALSSAMAQNGHPDTLLAVMGNTAAGKSTALRQQSDFNYLSQHLGGAINPDPIKHDIEVLAQEGGKNTISNTQAHLEGSVVSQRVEEQMLGKKGSSLVYDKRFSGSEDFPELLKTAQKHGKTVQTVDIDSDLTRSAVRVLNRPVGGEDPRVPFDAVAEGFRGNRGNRKEIIEGRPDQVSFDDPNKTVPGFKGVKDNPLVKSYDLMVPNDKGELTRVAYKRDGVWHGPATAEHQQLYNNALDNSQTPGIVDKVRNTVISREFITQHVDSARPSDRDNLKAALEKYEGKTLEYALNDHEVKLN